MWLPFYFVNSFAKWIVYGHGCDIELGDFNWADLSYSLISAWWQTHPTLWSWIFWLARRPLTPTSRTDQSPRYDQQGIFNVELTKLGIEVFCRVTLYCFIIRCNAKNTSEISKSYKTEYGILLGSLLIFTLSCVMILMNVYWTNHWKTYHLTSTRTRLARIPCWLPASRPETMPEWFSAAPWTSLAMPSSTLLCRRPHLAPNGKYQECFAVCWIRKCHS